jgi:hypothetical protein
MNALNHIMAFLYLHTTASGQPLRSGLFVVRGLVTGDDGQSVMRSPNLQD